MLPAFVNCNRQATAKLYIDLPVGVPGLFNIRYAGLGTVSPSCASVWPIRNTFVPQTEHVPLVAGVPRLVNVASGLCISRFCLHDMQYASMIFLLTRANQIHIQPNFQ